MSAGSKVVGSRDVGRISQTMSMGRKLGAGSQIPVNPNVTKWGIAASWDPSASPIDVDLQGIIVDSSGDIIDAVYYNNMHALHAVSHSGDEKTGDRKGYDEYIWVMMHELPSRVQIVIFVAAAYNRGHLKDVQNGRFHVMEEDYDNELACWDMEKGDGEVDAVAALVKDATGSWNLHVIEEPARSGRHFMDILEPVIGDLVRRFIPSAPKRQKLAFAMEKAEVMDLPATSSIHKVSAHLGWDAKKVNGEDVDVDVSVIFFDKDVTELGAVYFKNLEQFGVKHSGDNRTGHGDGDDEVISVNLEEVDAKVEQMFFVVNIYTTNVTFENVKNAHCRICDQDGNSMAEYSLHEVQGQSGLVLARLFREPGVPRWGFQAIGTFCKGSNWKDSLTSVIPVAKKAPRDLQLHELSIPAVKKKEQLISVQDQIKNAGCECTCCVM